MISFLRLRSRRADLSSDRRIFLIYVPQILKLFVYVHSDFLNIDFKGSVSAFWGYPHTCTREAKLDVGICSRVK